MKIYYDVYTLDSLFIELSNLAIYRFESAQKNYKDIKKIIYPKTNIDDINQLIKKYIDLYLNEQYQLLDLEKEKDMLLYSQKNFDETFIMCLIIIKENIYKAMCGDCIHILNTSKLFVSDKTYKQLKAELENHQPIPNSNNIIIDIEN